MSKDPIGLSGGNNLQHYAPSPIQWIDPLGLSGEIINDVDPKNIRFSQGYIEGKDKVQGMAKEMKAGTFDWRRSPLDVQKRNGQLVSGDNRRFAAARIAGVTCSIRIRGADEPMPGGGTYGGNMDKKTNSAPRKSGLPPINVGSNGTSNMPILVENKKTLGRADVVVGSQ